MNVRPSTKPPRPLASTLSKTSPLAKAHASPRNVPNRLTDFPSFPKTRPSPKTSALKPPVSSPSSSSRSSPHLAASANATSSRATSSSPSTVSSEHDNAPRTNTDSLSLLLGLVASPTVASSTPNVAPSSNPATPTFTLGSSRLRDRRKPSSPQLRLRTTLDPRTASDQRPASDREQRSEQTSPRASPQSYATSSPRLGAFDRHDVFEKEGTRRGVSPRSGYGFSSPATSTSASPALLPVSLSRDLSALLASPKPHELSHVPLKLLPRASSLKANRDGWPSKEDDNMFALRSFADLGPSQQDVSQRTFTGPDKSDSFVHFYPPTSKLSESVKGHNHQGDSFGRNTHTLSVHIKAGMDKYLKGIFDPQSNSILGRGEFNEDLTQNIITALAFSHDFSPIATAYMHLYLREWKDASLKIARLPVPATRTLPFGRPHVFQGVQLLPCERDGEYVVEAGSSQHLDDLEERASDFRIWIKVVLDDPDSYRPQDIPYVPIKGFALSRSHGATLRDVWQTCQAFVMLVRDLDELALMEETISDSEAGEDPHGYGQWAGGQEKLDYPRKPMDRGLYSRGVQPDYNNYPSDDNGPPRRPLGSNKTIVKHFNAVRAEKAERGEARNIPTKSSSNSKPRLKEPKEIMKAEARRINRFSPAHDGNLSDASNSSSTPMYQPSVNTQIISPHPDMDQARLAPMVMRTKPSFTADLESHHNVHQKRSPLNPVPTVVAAIPRVGSPESPEGNGRRWGYQWRQGSEFSGHPLHNAHNNANNHASSYASVRPPASAERPANRPSYLYPNHFYQS